MDGVELNPFSREFQEDPYPVYRWLRDEAPCYHNAEIDFFALSRYADVVEASQQPQLYSSVEGTTVERINTRGMLPMMIHMDPPEHDVNRRLVSRAFTPRSVAALEPFVRETAQGYLAPLADGGGGDFVEQFSALLPMDVIMELIGVPRADRNELRHEMDTALERSEDPPYITGEAIEAMAAMTVYWAALLEEKRKAPDDGLMSRLCEAEVSEGGETSRLSDEEVIGFCSLIGMAGTETLTKLLANAVVLFGRWPEEWETLCADPSLAAGAVEESLRYWAPSQYQGRVLTRDVEVHGTVMPEGSRVLLVTGAANRDEREYEDPDRFDIGRPTHLAAGFGHGLHFCLGAALARLEGRVGLQEFAALFPRYQVDEAEACRVHQSNVHGYASVPFAAG
ncbi:MAG: cytochrome P450 [Acidobacteriota bacterium]|nr:cytochrome P450 [Acidobacteriota bacterium]